MRNRVRKYMEEPQEQPPTPEQPPQDTIDKVIYLWNMWLNQTAFEQILSTLLLLPLSAAAAVALVLSAAVGAVLILIGFPVYSVYRALTKESE